MSDPAPRAQLVRALTLRDLVLFNLVAVLGLRWLATSAKTGPSSLVLWVLAALLFFVPQGIAVVRLSSRFPDSGGVYQWTKRTFGEGHGFFCGWCYWVCNVLYYPNLLISTAAIATFVVGRGESGLGDDWRYVLLATLVCLWGAVALNIVGVGTGKWLQNFGGVGSYITGAILIVVGANAVLTMPSANDFSGHMVPTFGDFGTLNLWSSIAFAYAGLELSSTMGDEVKDASRTLPRSVLISAPMIAGMYVLGTFSLLWLVPVGEINIVSGFLQGISAGTRSLGPWLWWLAPFAALAYTVGNIGGVGAWLSGPARVAFVIGLDKYFPPAFGKVHPRWRTPYVAILVQAALATIFLGVSLLGKGTTVEDAYLTLLLTMLLIYFIPYLYLFACLIVQARRDPPAERRGGDFVAGVAGFAMTAFAMMLAAVPTGGDDPLLFELKVVGGALFFILIGAAIYWRAPKAA